MSEYKHIDKTGVLNTTIEFTIFESQVTVVMRDTGQPLEGRDLEEAEEYNFPPYEAVSYAEIPLDEFKRFAAQLLDVEAWMPPEDKIRA
jgi:hypothetical protein